jgi:hypothetical protein
LISQFDNGPEVNEKFQELGISINPLIGF